MINRTGAGLWRLRAIVLPQSFRTFAFYFGIVSFSLIMGCSALYHYRNQGSTPKAIIRAVDNHGNVTTWELDYTLRSLKVTTDLNLEYEHEYMAIYEKNEAL